MNLFGVLHSYTPSPIFVQLGPFSIHWYGLCLGLSVLAAYTLAFQAWRRSGRALAKLDSLVLLLVVSGLVGARLMDVFVYEWPYFRSHLSEVLAVWQGGLAFHGALIGGGIALLWWVRREHETMLPLLDMFAPGLALAQAIGRWGNYFNQELFGTPTTLPWGIPIVPANRPFEYSEVQYFHPTFLYESLALVVLFLCLYLLYRRAVKPGIVFGAYLMASGVVRFVLEFVRLDTQLAVSGIRVGMLVSLLILGAGSALLVMILRRPNSNTPKP